jgi:hypothetical protein
VNNKYSNYMQVPVPVPVPVPVLLYSQTADVNLTMLIFLLLDPRRYSHWTSCGWGSGRKDAKVLSVWRHSQYSIENGEPQHPGKNTC